MKYSPVKVLVFMMVFIFLLSGCTVETNKNNGEEEKIIVYTSIYPMYEFASQIGKDRIQLRQMIPPGVEPHDWEPTGKLMGEMENADVFIYNGVGLENWVQKVIGSLGNKNLVIVEGSSGIPLLKGNKDHGNHDTYDPHIWLDPINAMKEAENIKDGLIKADGKNSDFYEKNYEDLVEQLKELDNKYREDLKDIKRREMVVSHDAFGYLAKEYGLKQIPIKGLSPQEEPSPSKMAEITELSKEHELKYIFSETLTNPKLAEVLAREIGAKTEVLNPIGALTKEEVDRGENYFTIMEENLKTLKKALGE